MPLSMAMRCLANQWRFSELEWGIEILEKGVEIFGQSEILWDSLATVYSMNDDTESALQASNKALELARQHQSKYISEIEAQNVELTTD